MPLVSLSFCAIALISSSPLGEVAAKPTEGVLYVHPSPPNPLSPGVGEGKNTENPPPAVAQDYKSYVAMRKKFHITYGTQIPALETLVGSRVLEVKGTIKGSFSSAKTSGILIDSSDGGSITVDCSKVPDWVQALGETNARMIIRANRSEPNGTLNSELLGVSPEDPIAGLEKHEQEVIEAAERRRAMRHHKGGGRIWTGPLPEGGKEVDRYANFIARVNGRLSSSTAYKIANGIVGYSRMYGVDARLIAAMVFTESGFNPHARSHVGAQGLGQLMPGTAAGLGVSNSLDSNQNLYGTVKLVRNHLNTYSRYSDNYDRILGLMLAAYNAGPGAVSKHGGIPPYRETQNYVRKVMSIYHQLCGR